jgi:hypothetical protein
MNFTYTDFCEMDKVKSSIDGFNVGISIAIILIMLNKAYGWCIDPLSEKLQKRITELETEMDNLDHDNLELSDKWKKQIDDLQSKVIELEIDNKLLSTKNKKNEEKMVSLKMERDIYMDFFKSMNNLDDTEPEEEKEITPISSSDE